MSQIVYSLRGGGFIRLRVYEKPSGFKLLKERKSMKTSPNVLKGNKPTAAARLQKELRTNFELYLMILPVLAFYIIFMYTPMYGVLIAFQDYSPARGISGSDWIGFKNFITFFSSEDFGRLVRNTLNISVQSLLFGFPAPIILALLINEVRTKWFAKTVKTISYMPHFISMVIACTLIREFTSDTGLINYFFRFFGYSGKTMLSQPKLFVPVYVLSEIWQEVGWGSIIYLAALSSIDEQLYEAAKIDGAGRIAQTWHITLPGILPTIIILFIMRMGTLLSVGYEKVMLLYNDGILSTADVISTYVYRLGFESSDFGLGTAVGLFNSVVNIILIVTSNGICKKLSGSSLF